MSRVMSDAHDDFRPPLNDEQLAILRGTAQRCKKIRRAASFAAFSGFSMIAFAGITALMAVFGSPSDFVIAGLLGAVGTNEVLGGAMMKRLNPRAPRRLAWNQLLLAILIVGYSAWSLYSTLRDPALKQLTGSSSDPQIAQVGEQIAFLVTWGLYGGLAACGIIFPAISAWYYLRRGPMIDRIIRESPKWALETVTAAA